MAYYLCRSHEKKAQRADRSGSTHGYGREEEEDGGGKTMGHIKGFIVKERDATWTSYSLYGEGKQMSG
jgi:hypothetical protein